MSVKPDHNSVRYAIHLDVYARYICCVTDTQMSIVSNVMSKYPAFVNIIIRQAEEDLEDAY